jgi:hypothetical protein
MPETNKPREMTLPAIRKRFDSGAWDHYDCMWLYTKAEQHAELLEVLKTALLWEMDYRLINNLGKKGPDWTERGLAAIRKALTPAERAALLDELMKRDDAQK